MPRRRSKPVPMRVPPKVWSRPGTVLIRGPMVNAMGLFHDLNSGERDNQLCWHTFARRRQLVKGKPVHSRAEPFNRDSLGLETMAG